MAVVAAQPQLGVRQRAQQVLAVGVGDDPVLEAVREQDRRLDRA